MDCEVESHFQPSTRGSKHQYNCGERVEADGMMEKVKRGMFGWIRFKGAIQPEEIKTAEPAPSGINLNTIEYH